MKGLDSSVLIRYLVQDRSEPARQINTFFEQSPASETYLINDIVLVEVANKLEESIRFDKSDIILAISELISNDQIRLESPERIKQALTLYECGRRSFSNCLKQVVDKSYGCSETITINMGRIQTISRF